MTYHDISSMNVTICLCNLPEGGTMGTIVSLSTNSPGDASIYLKGLCGDCASFSYKNDAKVNIVLARMCMLDSFAKCLCEII